MRNVSIFAAWRPHHEQDNAAKQADALQAHLAIALPRIFARQQITRKETLQVGKVNAVVIPIQTAFVFIPSVHALNCICNLYMQSILDNPLPNSFSTSGGGERLFC